MSKILKGKKEIEAFTGLDWRTIEKLIPSGFPVKKIEGGWYGFADNIEGFFQKITRGLGQKKGR